MHTTQYIKEFEEAVHNTLGEGYKLPMELKFLGNQIPIRTTKAYKKIHQLFTRNYFDADHTINLSHIRGNCIKLHVEMLKLIRMVLGIDTILTIGWTNLCGQDFYKFDKFSKDLFRIQADQKSVIDVHVWLTLPSYEIIDFVFLAHIAYISSSPEKKILLNKATDFPFFFGSSDFLYEQEHVIYHPKYVGKDSLVKNGIIEIKT